VLAKTKSWTVRHPRGAEVGFQPQESTVQQAVDRSAKTRYPMMGF